VVPGRFGEDAVLRATALDKGMRSLLADALEKAQATDHPDQ